MRPLPARTRRTGRALRSVREVHSAICLSPLSSSCLVAAKSQSVFEARLRALRPEGRAAVRAVGRGP
eukprot:561974-Prymnesium_polylepis.1